MQPLAGLPGGVSTAAVGINASGQVVGYSGNRAVLWSPAGAILDLGTLPGAVGAAATAINDLGQVAGYSYSAGGFRHAFLWTEAGGMQDLGVSLGLTSSSATAISQTAVVGTSDNLGFRWTAAGGMQSLPIRAAASTGKASGVNDAGVVVGSEASPGSYNNCGYYCYYYNTPLVRSVEWSSTGERVDISASGGFVAEDNEALGINNNGQVVGRNHSHGYLWSQSAGLVDVGVLPGRSSSTATAINDNGQVVGSSW
jgi:probable HAF family extracellular repeat protein